RVRKRFWFIGDLIRKPIEIDKGRCSLKSNSLYEATFYFYHCQGYERYNVVAVNGSGGLNFFSSNILMIDNVYDTKKLKFRTNISATKQYGFMTIDSRQVILPPSDKALKCADPCLTKKYKHIARNTEELKLSTKDKVLRGVDFSLEYSIRGDLAYFSLLAIIFGLFIWLSGLSSSHFQVSPTPVANPSAGVASPYLNLIKILPWAKLGFAIIAGFIAMLGLKKPY
ncbi:MAG: hypothetical protein R6W92_12430, partial [Desulfocurvibacter africanus]